MKELNLINQNLTELIEENLINLCHLNGFEPKKLTELVLIDNKLKNVDFIQSNMPFINIKQLRLSNNNNIQYLKNLEILSIRNLNIKNKEKTIKPLKSLKKLNTLWIYNLKDYTEKQLKKELPNIKKIYD